jgi:xanthine phosphoribosyltransferase
MNSTLRKDIKKLVINNNDFKGLVNKICRDIALSNWKPDYIVGLTRGGLLPAVMISHYLNVPMQSLDVSLRDGGECVSNLGMAEDAFGYINHDPMCSGDGRKNILIVDDINDQGSTLNWIMNDWPSGCFPSDERWGNVWNNNVRFAVVVDNLSSQCSVGMDYWGMEVNKAEEDVWIEFPYEEWWTK